MSTQPPEPPPAWAAWLDTFAACVRDRDTHAGAQLFDPDCSSFGTRAERTHGLDDLVARQWTPIWTATTDFRFLTAGAEVCPSQDGSQVVVLVQWNSQGHPRDQETIVRRGRATIVLRPDLSAPHGLRAVHTHFSETPGT